MEASSWGGDEPQSGTGCRACRIFFAFRACPPHSSESVISFPNMKVLVAVVVFCAVSPAAEHARAWTTRDGRTFDAELSAADGLRATFTQPGKPLLVVPLASLAPTEVEIIRKWRLDWRKPLVVPSRLAPWPVQAVAPAGDVCLRGEDAGVFTYESVNFRITSELKLPPGVANDLARVFEATRAVLIAMPLGLHAGGEHERYTVAMFRSPGGYEKAGGVGGSGGHYDGHTRRMLVLLPNLGIEEKEGTLRFDYARNLFILKHEVTHQLLARWHRRMPMWVSEGIAEFVASLPYAQGHYTLQNPGSGLRDYLLKWHNPVTTRSLRLIPPARLMAMRPDDWESALSQQDAYDMYNSAAILTYYFIQQDGGTPLAGFLDALRRGEDAATAERTYLLRGKTRDALASVIIALGKKLGVELTP